MDRKLRIYFENEQDKIKLKYSTMILVRRAVEAVLDFEDFRSDAEVSVTFTDNEKIKALNNTYRNTDRETDVLSFPMITDEDVDLAGPLMLGDIVLSLEKAKEQGELYGHGFAREVAFLCIHSTLHLLGYDHELSEEDDIEMRRRQSTIADIIGLGVKKGEDKYD